MSKKELELEPGRGPTPSEEPLVQVVRVPRMTATWRAIHWFQALAVVVCFVTGLYIANPFYAPNPTSANAATYFMAWNRAIHFYGALVLDVSMFLIAYLYVFSTKHKDITDLRPSPENLTQFKEALLNFVTFNRRKRLDTSKRDPFLAVLFLLFHVIMLTQLLTGFQLYVAAFSANISTVGSWWPRLLHFVTDWTLTVFGGNVGVRETHLVTAWIIIAWAVFHIYYEIWRSIMWKEGDIVISFGGYKYVKRAGTKHD